MNTLDEAVLMIKEVRDALARGTKHYDRDGKLLETPFEILACLQREGSVLFVPQKEDQ
jgi:hypothetical protein